MPTFKVYGADDVTGADTSVVIHAANPGEAEAIANHRRILVTRVVEVVQQADEDTVTVQQTSKRWKLRMAVGASIAVIGAAMVVADMQMSAHTGRFSTLGYVGIATFVAGLLVYADANLRAWWFHG